MEAKLRYFNYIFNFKNRKKECFLVAKGSGLVVKATSESVLNFSLMASTWESRTLNFKNAGLLTDFKATELFKMKSSIQRTIQKWL